MKLQIFTETASETFVLSKIYKNSYRAPIELKPILNESRHLDLSNGTHFIENEDRLDPQK